MNIHMVDIFGINLHSLYGRSYLAQSLPPYALSKIKKNIYTKDLKITSFATILRPYGTIIFLPAIYSMCAYTNNQPWKHRAKHVL